MKPIRALLSAYLFASVLGGMSAAAADSRPNIVFILADDLGGTDLGCYGQKFAETPHLDRLASQSLQFSQAYAPAPICSASRASLLTGRTPARLHFEFVTKAKNAKGPSGTPLKQPSFPYNLPLEEVSLAEALGPAGYHTGFFGKWHLTEANDRYLGHGTSFGPRQQGFDESSEERGSHPYNYVVKGKSTLPPYGDYKDGEFAPDALTDQAIRFLKENKDRRFFLYLSEYYVHEPLRTRCAWLAGKYQEKAKRLGLNLGEEQVLYAAFIETMDHLIGRVLDALDALGLSENTMVVFTSDNGGRADYVFGCPLRSGKWTLYEGGLREPFLVRWPGKTKAGSLNATPIIGTDVFPTLCEVAGAKLPEGRMLDGVSLVPVLKGGEATLARQSLTWHFPFYHKEFVDTKPVSAIRHGDMKLLYFYEDERVELYDLARDPGEKCDLAASRPAEAEVLRKKLLESLKAQDARFPVRRKLPVPAIGSVSSKDGDEK